MIRPWHFPKYIALTRQVDWRRHLQFLMMPSGFWTVYSCKLHNSHLTQSKPHHSSLFHNGYPWYKFQLIVSTPVYTLPLYDHYNRKEFFIKGLPITGYVIGLLIMTGRLFESMLLALFWEFVPSTIINPLSQTCKL